MGDHALCLVWHAAVSAPCDFRYYDFVMAAFMAILLCSNLIGAAKIAGFGAMIFAALLTPLTYRVMYWLKQAENVDVFDRDPDFTPFSLDR